MYANERQKKCYNIANIAFVFLISLFPDSLLAAQSAAIQGRLLNSDGSAVTSSVVVFTVQIKSPGAEDCLLYQESQTLNLSTSQGAFTLSLGSGTRAAASVDGGNPLNVVFSNTATISLTAATTPCAGAATSYTPSADQTRKINIFFDDGSGVDQIPTINMAWVPQATYAQNAGQLGGANASQFLQVNVGTIPAVLSGADYTAFTDLLAGTSNKYLAISSTEGTSGNLNLVQTASVFAPTSGTASFSDLALQSTINQTGGANGITRGLYVNPTLTAAANYRAIETVSGDVIFGSTSGNVGIGTTAPTARLEVSGTTKTRSLASASQIISSGTTAIDWDNGNQISTDYDCAASFTFANLRDGGTYTLVVTGTGTTQCSFSATSTGADAAAGTLTYRFKPANAVRTASSHSIYTLMRIGTVVYVSWATGW